ncbi:MAG: hypothetical protein ABS898_08030, partial [Psychrobacillus sp.]
MYKNFQLILETRKAESPALPRQANGEKRGGSSSATGAFIHLTPRGKAMKLDIKKSGIACTAPTGKWGKARRQLLSHR